MSVDIVIKQKFLGNKTMPLDVILGETLHYGTFENEQLNVGEMGNGEIIVFNPDSIGRGFSITWTPKEKKSIALRLLSPPTTQELTDFYATVKRMATHWNATLTVDGNKIGLEAFLESFQDSVDFNNKSLNHLAQQLLDEKEDGVSHRAARYYKFYKKKYAR